MNGGCGGGNDCRVAAGTCVKFKLSYDLTFNWNLNSISNLNSNFSKLTYIWTSDVLVCMYVHMFLWIDVYVYVAFPLYICGVSSLNDNIRKCGNKLSGILCCRWFCLLIFLSFVFDESTKFSIWKTKLIIPYPFYHIRNHSLCFFVVWTEEKHLFSLI